MIAPSRLVSRGTCIAWEPLAGTRHASSYSDHPTRVTTACPNQKVCKSASSLLSGSNPQKHQDAHLQDRPRGPHRPVDSSGPGGHRLQRGADLPVAGPRRVHAGPAGRRGRRDLQGPPVVRLPEHRVQRHQRRRHAVRRPVRRRAPRLGRRLRVRGAVPRLEARHLRLVQGRRPRFRPAGRRRWHPARWRSVRAARHPAAGPGCFPGQQG